MTAWRRPLPVFLVALLALPVLFALVRGHHWLTATAAADAAAAPSAPAQATVTPGRIVRSVTARDLELIRHAAANYRERARRYGVNPQVVAGVVGYALRGMPLPEFHSDGKEIPVRVRFRA